jgi:hypothetical protein
MKKLFLSITALCLALIVQAQTNPVDAMFDKYSEKDGFTVVSISSRMLSMFAGQDADNKEAENLFARLKSIKILSVEDSLLNRDLNFYTELSKKLDLSVYEELMVVKEGKDITRFLIQQKGDLITELLVISGGPSGNSLISIRGNLDLKSISNISREMGIQDLEKLDKIEK